MLQTFKWILRYWYLSIFKADTLCILTINRFKDKLESKFSKGNQITYIQLQPEQKLEINNLFSMLVFEPLGIIHTGILKDKDVLVLKIPRSYWKEFIRETKDSDSYVVEEVFKIMRRFEIDVIAAPTWKK